MTCKISMSVHPQQLLREPRSSTMHEGAVTSIGGGMRAFLIFSKLHAHRSYVCTSRPVYPVLVYNVAPRNAVSAKRPPMWYHSPQRIPKIAPSTCTSFPLPFCLLQLLQLPVDLLMLLQKQECEHSVRTDTNEARYPALEHPTEAFCSHGVRDGLH